MQRTRFSRRQRRCDVEFEMKVGVLCPYSPPEGSLFKAASKHSSPSPVQFFNKLPVFHESKIAEPAGCVPFEQTARKTLQLASSLGTFESPQTFTEPLEIRTKTASCESTSDFVQERIYFASVLRSMHLFALDVGACNFCP